jgi:hypothetical protein
MSEADGMIAGHAHPAAGVCIEDAPVFIFSSGQRTGSTLLQALINTHRDIHLMGEHSGAFAGLIEQQRLVKSYEDGQPSRPGRLLVAPRMQEAARAYLRTLYVPLAQARGSRRWGFKEVRYDAEMAGYLCDLFPSARIIWLTRNPVDVLISMKRREDAAEPWNRTWTRGALGHWEGINRSFLGLAQPMPQVKLVRYEDLMDDQASQLARLCTHLSVEVEDLDLGIFEWRYALERGVAFEDRQPIPQSLLTEEERALITTPGIIEACAALGYELRFD